MYPYGRTHTHTHNPTSNLRENIYDLCMYIYDMRTYIILRSRCICVRKIICARRVRRVWNNIYIYILRARVKVFPRQTTIKYLYTRILYEKNLFSTIDRCVYDDDDDYHDDLRQWSVTFESQRSTVFIKWSINSRPARKCCFTKRDLITTEK